MGRGERIFVLGVGEFGENIMGEVYERLEDGERWIWEITKEALAVLK